MLPYPPQQTKMATTTAAAAVTEAATEASVFSVLDSKFAQLATDPLAALKSIDVQTVAIVGVSILLVVFTIDLIAYLVAMYQVPSKPIFLLNKTYF